MLETVIRLHIPKTGGSSLTNHFAGKYIGDFGDTQCSLFEMPKCLMLFCAHLTPKMLVKRGILSEHAIRRACVFAVVRNPWARFASLFHGMGADIRPGSTFEDFVLTTIQNRTLLTSSEPIPIGALQHEWLLLDGMSVCDIILRRERLDEDWQVLAAKLGIDSETPGHQNVHQYPPYPELYTDAAREAVEDAEAYVIKRFGYRFGEDC